MTLAENEINENNIQIVIYELFYHNILIQFKLYKHTL